MAKRPMRQLIIPVILVVFLFLMISCVTGSSPAPAVNLDRASALRLTRFAEYINRGRALFYEYRYEEAIEMVYEAITIYPDNVIGYTLLGQIHFRLNNFEEALRYASLALERDPAFGAANGLMGAILHFGFGDHGNALHYYNLAIWYEPTADSHFFHRGQLHRLKGHNDMALQDFNAAIAIKPLNSTNRRTRGILAFTPLGTHS